MKPLDAVVAILLSGGAVAVSGCCLVDEDLSNCVETESLTVDYQLRLVTNMHTELETVLSLDADIKLSTELTTYLGGVFTDHAHDVDLSFYDTHGDMPILEHMSETMDASQSSYTLYLPVREYMHTSVANIAENQQVTLEGTQFCHSSRLVQRISSEGLADPHETGLFTARKNMDVLSGVDQSFDVRLYMANAATALVLDPDADSGFNDIRVEVTGFASSFNIADSTYVFSGSSLADGKDASVRTQRLQAEEGGEQCYASVHFPSRDLPESKVIIETEEPFISESADVALWGWAVYVTLSDGTVTRSFLGVKTPLKAGQLKIVRAKVHRGGEVTTEDPLVGVSVTLDWQSGSDHDIEL